MTACKKTVTPEAPLYLTGEIVRSGSSSITIKCTDTNFTNKEVGREQIVDMEDLKRFYSEDSYRVGFQLRLGYVEVNYADGSSHIKLKEVNFIDADGNYIY